MTTFLNATKDHQGAMDRWLKMGAPGDPPEPPEPPEHLVLWQDMKDYGCLLVDGGLLDQPYLLWVQVQAAGRAHDRWSRQEEARNKIHAQSNG